MMRACGELHIGRLLVAYAMLAGVAGCASRPSVDVFVTGMVPLRATLLEQRTRLDLRVQNLGEKRLRVRGLSVRLDLNDVRFAQGVSNEAFELPPLGEATTSVVLSTSTLDVIRQLLGIESRPAFGYELSGRLYTSGSGKLRIKRAGEFNRAQLERLGPPLR